MEMMTLVLTLVLGPTFIAYGWVCLSSAHMKAEFARYRLESFRKLVGALEILGGLGVLCGLLWKPLLIFSASGLALLMILGIGVRIRIRDSWIQMSPAAILLLISLALIGRALQG